VDSTTPQTARHEPHGVMNKSSCVLPNGCAGENSQAALIFSLVEPERTWFDPPELCVEFAVHSSHVKVISLQ